MHFPRLFYVCDSFPCIRMDLGVHHVCKEEYHQYRADSPDFPFVEPVHQVIDHRSDGIDDRQSADAEQIGRAHV